MDRSQRVMIGVLLGLLAYGVYTWRLGWPLEPYFDEVYHVSSARSFLGPEGSRWTAHPLFGNRLIALGIQFFGDQAWAWRLCPALAGVATLFVLYGLAKTLTRHAGWSLTAALLFGLAGLPLVNARVAMLHSFTSLWMLLALLIFCQDAISHRWRRRPALFGAGFVLGIALATKWIALITGVFIVACLLLCLRHERDRLHLVSEILVVFLGTTILTYGLITATLLPAQERSWATFWHEQISMLTYHTSLTATHTYGSHWAGWPLMLRPIWYFFQREGDSVMGILCIGNPAIFWMIPLAMGYVVWRFLARPTWETGIILGGFLIHWLSYAILTRVQFFSHFDSALPFAVLALTALLRRLWSSGRSGRALVVSYLVLVVGLFIYWYPLFIGLPISESFYRHHLWFRSWI